MDRLHGVMSLVEAASPDATFNRWLHALLKLETRMHLPPEVDFIFCDEAIPGALEGQ